MMNLPCRGLRLGQLQMLEPVLKKWQSLNDKIASEWISVGAVPWWFNERASLSIFAGAVWRCGGIAFEEYSVNREVVSKRKVAYKSGRCDIEFSIAGRNFIGEAKQNWPTFGRRKDKARADVKSDLMKAQQEVIQVLEKGSEGLGMTFVVPGIPFIAKGATEELLIEFLEQLQGLQKTTIAWVFPPFARFMRPSKESSNYRYIYPGVILVIAPANAKLGRNAT